VRKFPNKTWLWAGIFLLYPWVAYAAGLGKLTVLSTLGQPLSAEVDLVSVQKDELSTLVARIASPDAFQQANMQYSPALIGVRMTIERRSDGKPYIRIVSTRSINDPFLAILIELTWAQGRLLREYTHLSIRLAMRRLSHQLHRRSPPLRRSRRRSRLKQNRLHRLRSRKALHLRQRRSLLRRRLQAGLPRQRLRLLRARAPNTRSSAAIRSPGLRPASNPKASRSIKCWSAFTATTPRRFPAT